MGFCGGEYGCPSDCCLVYIKLVMFHIKIKGKEAKNNMQANCLTLHTPLTSGVGLKGQMLKLGT